MPVNETLARENFDHYIYARDNGHLNYLKKAKQCEDYFAGIQWDEIVKQRLENVGRPALTINKVIATIATVLGEQLNNRADISFLPGSNGSQATSDALTKLFIQIASENKLDWLESEVFADGVITSRGFFDVRVAFGDQMQGEVDIKLLNPNNVVIDPDGEEYDPETWKEVFVTKWMSPTDIATLYNKADAEVLKHRARSDFMNTYDSVEFGNQSFGASSSIPKYGPGEDRDIRRSIRVVERQHKKLRNADHFVDLRTGDTRVIPENWKPERVREVANAYELGVTKKLAEVIRWTVSADNLILFDDWSPYKYFTPVPFFPFFRRGTTIGMVENLLGPQDQLNKTSSQELHVVNTTANSGWKLKSGSLKNMDADELEQRGSQTGLVMELDDVSDAEKIQPNQVPTGLDRISGKADEYIKEISGVSDSSRGFDRADVAAKAIQAKAARGTLNIAKPLDNLARTRHMVADRVLALVQTYYTEERVVQITTGGLNAKTEEVTINQATAEGIVNDLTVGEYSSVVTTVPARNAFDDSQFQEAAQLREMGIPIPDAVMIEYSHLSRKSEIAEEIRAAAGGGEASEAQQQLEQLEVELKAAELEESRAEAQRKAADANLANIRAKKTEQDIMQEAQGGGEEEARAQELLLKREEIQSNAALAREKLAAEISLKREAMRQDNLLKRAEAATRIEDQQAKDKESNNEQQSREAS